MYDSGLKANIFALSTPVGGAIALLRASGSGVLTVLKAVFTGRIEPRVLNCGRVIDPDDGRTLDSAMAVFFPAPHSYTGEDMFELNLHGSYAVARAVCGLLLRHGMREAQPGEFTKRAFLNGKLDLVQADAVMDLVRSDTERSARAALEQLGGGLSRRIAAIEDKLIGLASELSAAMDYPEEMEEEVLSDSEAVITEQLAELDALIASGRAGRILREGAKAVILGSPNVGKSSLLNALTGTGRAIVTDIAGTTRDVLEERIDLSGCPIRLVDTAGLHSTDDTVEKIGIERALNEAATAQIIIRVFDGSSELTDEETQAVLSDGDGTLYAVNKYDLDAPGCERLSKRLVGLKPGLKPIMISCRTGCGLDELAQAMLNELGASDGESAIVTNERHLACLKRARKELCDALCAPTADLRNLTLDSALMYLGEITGRTAGEEVLDGIFKRFCVGK